MRRTWRLLRLLWTVLVHTVYLSLLVRRRPPEARPALRAERQRIGCRALCRILNFRVTVCGEFPEAEPRLVVCNHFSALDPIMLASQLPVSFVSKAEVQHWPFFGWVARTFGVLFVERERPTKTSRFVLSLRQRLEEGVPVLVFPEGTTSRTEKVMPFKTGAFAAVAQEEGAVLPIHLKVLAVEGEAARADVRARVVWQASQSFAQHLWSLIGMKRLDLEIRIGTPLATSERDRKELAQQAHEQVAGLGV